MFVSQGQSENYLPNLHKTAIVDSITDGVLTLDQEWRITHINSQAATSLGVDHRDSIGLKITEVMIKENELFFSKIYDRRKLYSEPLMIRRKTDRIKLAVSSTPLRDSDGTERGTVVILQPMADFADHLKKNEGLEMDAAQRLIGKAVDLQERALEYERLVNARLGVLVNSMRDLCARLR